MNNRRITKSALITGASSGIGAEFARQLAYQGYDLVLVARRKERLDNLASELHQEHSIHVEVLVADLTKEIEIQQLGKHIIEHEALDLLVNNAGFGMHGMFSDLDISKHIAMIYVHDIACVRLTHAALPGMLANNQGGIINVSSISGLVPIGNITYGATKTFQVVFSETLQMELAGTGIKIQALCPGYTYTEFHDRQDLSGFQRSQIPKPLWTSVEQVVSESLRGLEKGKIIVVPGSLYRLFVSLGRGGIFAPLFRNFAVRVRSKRYDRS
jgi:short-subunit dehydrogenase